MSQLSSVRRLALVPAACAALLLVSVAPAQAATDKDKTVAPTTTKKASTDDGTVTDGVVSGRKLK